MSFDPFNTEGGGGAVTNAGTFAVQEDGPALTALQLIDDSVVTLGTDTYSEATSKAIIIGGVRNDTLATLADTDNEFAPFQVNASGALYTAVTDVIPGTGATNSGKAIGSTSGVTDTGVALLAKHEGDTTHTSVSDGEYDVLRISEFGGLHTEPEQHHVIDEMDALEANGGTWAAIDSDTTGVTLSTKHVLGTGSIEFDKVDGGANSGIGGITKALTAVNLGGLSPHDILQTVVYVGSTEFLDGGSAFFFLRLGTNSTDYNEWRIDGTEFTAGRWETVAFEIGDASFAGQGGNGWDASAVTYVAIGFSFDALDDPLANIYVDEISFHTNQHVNAAINAEITSSVSSANINVQKIGGSPTTKGAGNVGNGSQRVVLADNVALPPGTNAIGKLAANSGVDIGDVDVTSLPGSIDGPGSPSIDSFTQFAINLNAGANQVLVSSSANKQIWVYAVTYTLSVAGTVSFQDEDDAAITGIMDHAANSGLAVGPSGNFAMPLWKLGTDKDLEVDVVTAAIDGWISYAIVSV